MAETTEQVRTPLEEATYNKLNQSVGEGRIVRIVGPVVDVKFDDQVPAIYTALVVDDDVPSPCRPPTASSAGFASRTPGTP